jgi:soluble lytic murein transglycosylase
MSSMVRNSLIAALLVSGALVAAPAAAQSGRASMVAGQPSSVMAYAIARWEQLTASPGYGFEDYASFLLSYPGVPDEDKLKGYAEGRLGYDYVDPQRLLAYFDRNPPITNNGRAQYALALISQRPERAEAVAREAWRGGEMSDAAFSQLFATYAGRFTPEDHDARMDALLWQRNAGAAALQLPYVSPAKSASTSARCLSRAKAMSLRVSTSSAILRAASTSGRASTGASSRSTSAWRRALHSRARSLSGPMAATARSKRASRSVNSVASAS